MKSLSLKLDNAVFEETEEITAQLDITRNRYINEALEIYNRLNKRRLLKKQLTKESALTTDDAMEVLKEMEMMVDGTN